MKKISKAILLLTLVLCLAACGRGSGETAGSSTGANSSFGSGSAGAATEPSVAVDSSSEQPGSSGQGSQEPDRSAPAEENHTLYILMFHDFVEGDGADCNNWTLSVSRFRENLQWLSDHGYTTVLPSQLAAGEPLPQRAVMITLDDGYESNYRLALPVLQEFDAKAVVSLIVNHIDRQEPGWLTWDMCREMSETGLIEFGSHTYESHAGQGILRRDGEKRRAYEDRIFPDIEKSISLIQSELGTEINFFAYPHGTTDKWASKFIKEHFAVTVTTQHGPADISKGLYDMPRHNIHMAADLSKFLPA